jgi:hypothetical protein
MAIIGNNLTRKAGEKLRRLPPPNYGLTDERVALLKNPTVEGAMKFWNFALMGKPASEDAILAGVHKARIMWPGSTATMIEESKLWLLRRGLKIP